MQYFVPRPLLEGRTFCPTESALLARDKTRSPKSGSSNHRRPPRLFKHQST